MQPTDQRCAGAPFVEGCSGNNLSFAFAKLANVSTRFPQAAWVPVNWIKPSPSRRASPFVLSERPVKDYVQFLERTTHLVEATYACRCGIVAEPQQPLSAALHVRCGDHPFLKCRDGHLPDLAYWDFVAAQLKKAQLQMITIHHSTEHKSFGVGTPTWYYDRSEDRLFPNAEETRACNGISRALVVFFRRRGFAVQFAPERETAAQALAKMLGAHTVVQFIPSSFSLFVGLVKAAHARERFITPSYYRETHVGVRLPDALPSSVPWLMYHERCPILHKVANSSAEYVQVARWYAHELLGNASGSRCLQPVF